MIYIYIYKMQNVCNSWMIPHYCLDIRNIRYLQFCIASELMRIQDWFNANKLTLNVSRCSYLLFNTSSWRSNDFNLTLKEVNIPRVRAAKLLGTWIDDQLTWETHVGKLMTKLRCGIGMLRCSQNLLTCKAKKNFCTLDSYTVTCATA